MKLKRVILAILIDRIHVMLARGNRIVDCHTLEFAEHTDPAAWLGALDKQSPQIRKVIQELEAEGLHCRVVYRSPTSVVDFSTLQVRWEHEAAEAAVLAAIDAIPYNSLSAVHEHAVVGRDSGRPPQTHVVVAVDRKDVVEKIAEHVNAVGLRFVSATPIGALLMAELASDALRRSPDEIGDGCTGRLYLGLDSSILVVSENQKLLLVRQMSIGVNALVSAMTGPINGDDLPATLELDKNEAERILRTHGVPDRDALLDKSSGLKGSHVLPLLAPVLQRLVVEIRQTLRFSLSDSQRTRVRLAIDGPGAAIAGVSGVLENELKVTVLALADSKSPWSRSPDEMAAGPHETLPADRDSGESGSSIDRSTIEYLSQIVTAAERWSSVGLAPAEVSQGRQLSRLRRWLWAGAAAALIVTVADAFRQEMHLNNLRHEAESLSSLIANMKTLRTRTDHLAEAMTEMRRINRIVAEETAGTVHLRAVLHEFSRLTPDEIRLTGLTTSRDRDRYTGRMTGIAIYDDSADEQPLKTYVDRLQKSPLFDSVTLGGVQHATVDGRTVHRFDATFTCTPVKRTSVDASDDLEDPTVISRSPSS